MLNSIVSKLALCLGAYALALFLVTSTANYSYHNLRQQSSHRRQKCAKLAAQELLKIETRVRRDQLWFYPGALIAWFLRGGYSEICEALGLSVFANPYLDKQGVGDDVPWDSPLRLIFARKPAQSSRIRGDDQHAVLNPQVPARQVEAPLDPDVSVDLPRKRLRTYGPDFGTEDDFDQVLAFGRTPQNTRKPQMFDPMALLVQAASQVPRESQGEMVPGMSLGGMSDLQPAAETAYAPFDACIDPVCRSAWPGDAGWAVAGENTMGLGTMEDHGVWMDLLFENDEYTNHQLA